MFHRQHLENENWKLVDEYFGQFDEDLGLVGDDFGLVDAIQDLFDEVLKAQVD